MNAKVENVDYAELAKFEALAARWWDPAGDFKPLHAINPLRLDFIDQRAPLAGKRVVDVGCGGGILTESMSARGADVLGIDLAQAPLSVAELHKLESQAKVNYQRISAESLASTETDGFDVVTCLKMLEHVPNPSSTIAACHALVKPGGWVFLSTINRNPKAYLLAIIGAEYVLKLLPRGTHDYQKFIRPSEMHAWARKAGLHLSEIIGMSYNPLTERYRLGADVSVNYLAAFRKPEADSDSD